MSLGRWLILLEILAWIGRKLIKSEEERDEFNHLIAVAKTMQE
jgi:hypothetical protein